MKMKIEKLKNKKDDTNKELKLMAGLGREKRMQAKERINNQAKQASICQPLAQNASLARISHRRCERVRGGTKNEQTASERARPAFSCFFRWWVRTCAPLLAIPFLPHPTLMPCICRHTKRPQTRYVFSLTRNTELLLLKKAGLGARLVCSFKKYSLPRIQSL